MEKITILQNGGGWIDNIGNAFIDLGSMECLREANINADIHNTSVFPMWVFYHVNKGIKGWLLKKPGDRTNTNVFNLQNHSKINYVVQSGAFLSKHWFEVHGETLLKLKAKGVGIIINGGGMGESEYSHEEIERTREYFRKLNPYIFISRDKESFESFKDLAEYSYSGIDAGFFISDHYRPLQLDVPEYVILNFDKQPEPNLNIDKSKSVIRTHHSFWCNFAFYQYLKMKKNYYNRENTMISELPYDYLNLYANTSVTYSDRVHACVGTLAYGNPARLFSRTPRSLLFERVGASKITEKVIKLNMDKIEKEKQKQIDFLSETLKN